MTDDWNRVGEAVASRLDELGLTKAEVHRDFGITGETLNRYMAGERIVRKDKKRQLAKAMRWSPNSIDLILQGLEPVSEDDEVSTRVAAVESSVQRLESEVQEIRSAVDSLVAAISANGLPT